MNFIYSNFVKNIIIVKTLTTLVAILFINISISQEININENSNINNPANQIINKYFEAIGGLKKINKISSLYKKFTAKIVDAANINLDGELKYKTPNLFYSNLSISQIGEIESLKYDGENCIIIRNHNNKKIVNKMEGEVLDKKKINFYPFPILALTKKNTLFTLLDAKNNLDTAYHKIQINNHKNDTTNLFFDKINFYLVKKEYIDNGKKEIIEYEDYKSINGIIFPFREKLTIEIDGNIVQKNINTYTEIIINQKFNKKEFQ
tara:strand:- start:20611 stop:21402 length:792 start_codon:yes stop_codon:yes gene_type:complete